MKGESTDQYLSYNADAMDVAIESLISYMAKLAGAGTAESLALAALIKAKWKGPYQSFLNELIPAGIDFAAGTHSAQVTDQVIAANSSAFAKFADEVPDEEDFNHYLDLAFDNGIRAGTVVKAEGDLYSLLAQMTGSKRANTRRAVNRWFKDTQGKYFERFIIPETLRVQKLVKKGGKPETLRKLGMRYKKFVKADGYWGSVADLDAGTASVFGQLSALSDGGRIHYRINAILDQNTCPVCVQMDGTTWTVNLGRRTMAEIMSTDSADIATAFPWPRIKALQSYDNPQKSPYSLPPYHPSCRCSVVGTPEKPQITAAQMRNYRAQNRLGGTNNARARRMIEPCLVRMKRTHKETDAREEETTRTQVRGSVVKLSDYMRSISKKELSKRCLKDKSYNITAMQLGYEGEDIIRDLLNFPGSSHKATMDFEIPKGKRSKKYLGLEIKTKRADAAEYKASIKGSARKKKEAWIKRTKDSDPWMVMVIRDANGVSDIYVKEGIAACRVGTMKWIGQVKRTSIGRAGKTIFDPEVAEHLVKVLNRKAPGLPHKNLTAAEIKAYRKKHKIGKATSDKRLGKYLSACVKSSKADLGAGCQVDLASKVDAISGAADSGNLLNKKLGFEKVAADTPVDIIMPKGTGGAKGFGFMLHHVPEGSPLYAKPVLSGEFKWVKKRTLHPAMIVTQPDGKGGINVYVKQKFKWTGEKDLKFVGTVSDSTKINGPAFQKTIYAALEDKPYTPIGSGKPPKPPKPKDKPKKPPVKKDIPDPPPIPKDFPEVPPVDTNIPEPKVGKTKKPSLKKPIPWKEETTVAGVDKQLKSKIKRYFGEDVDVSFSLHRYIDKELWEGMDVEWANRTAKQFLELMRRFPASAKMLTRIDTHELGQRAIAQCANKRWPTRSGSHMIDNEISFNIRNYDVKEKLMFKADLSQGRTTKWVVTDSVESIATHEYGHLIYNNLRTRPWHVMGKKLGFDLPKEPWHKFDWRPPGLEGLGAESGSFADSWTEIYKYLSGKPKYKNASTESPWLMGVKNKPKPKWEHTKALSKYADYNEKELFSECFAMYIHRPDDMPKWLKEFFDAINMEKLFENSKMWGMRYG